MKRMLISLAVLSLLALASCRKKTAGPVVISEIPYQDVEVVRVISGDTFDAIVEGRVERCRILYINTPERGEPGFDEATEFLKEQLEAGKVDLYFDTPGVVKRDRYGRLLVGVIVYGRMGPRNIYYYYDVGVFVIREGWSLYYTKYGRAIDDKTYREAEVEAKWTSSGILAEEPEKPFEGSWIRRAPKTILGAGADEVITFARVGELWIVSFATTRHYSVNERKEPTTTTRGPFAARIADSVLRFTEDGKERAYTIRIEGDAVVCPAFVRTDERTWVIRTGAAPAAVFRCEFDPTKEPRGKAEFPCSTSPGIRMSYAYKSAGAAGEGTKQLKFQVRLKDGILREQCRLVWDEYGAPRFEGSSWYGDFSESRYIRVTGDD